MSITIGLDVHYANKDITLTSRRKFASLLMTLSLAYNNILMKMGKLYVILKREENLKMMKLQLSINAVYIYCIANNVFNTIKWCIAVYANPCITLIKRLGYVINVV